MPISNSSRKWMNCFVHLVCISAAINATEPSEGNIVATVGGAPSQQTQAAYPWDADIVKQLNGTGAIIIPMEPQWGIPGPEEGYPEREFTKSWHHLASTKTTLSGSTVAGMLQGPNTHQPNAIRVLMTQPNNAVPTILSSNRSTPSLAAKVGSIVASRPDFDLNSSGSANSQLSMKNGEGEATATIVLQEAQNLTKSNEGIRVNDDSAQARQIVFGTGQVVGQRHGQTGSQLITSTDRGSDATMKPQILEAPSAIEHVIYLGGEKKKVESEIPAARDPNMLLTSPRDAANTVVIRQELRIPQEEGLANETRGPDEKEESAPVNIVNVIRADGQTLNLQLPNNSAQDAVSDETANNIITQLIGQGYGQWFGKPSNIDASAPTPVSSTHPSEVVSHGTEGKTSPWNGIIPVGAGWPQASVENPVRLLGQKTVVRLPVNIGITKPDNNAGSGNREIKLPTAQPQFGYGQGNPNDSNNAIDRVGFKLKGKQDNIFSPNGQQQISIPLPVGEPNGRTSTPIANTTMEPPNSSQPPQAEPRTGQPKSQRVDQLDDDVLRNVNLPKFEPNLQIIKIPSGVISARPVDVKDGPVIDNTSGTTNPSDQARPSASQATFGSSNHLRVISPAAKLVPRIPGVPSQQEPHTQPTVVGSGKPSTANPPTSATMPQPNSASINPTIEKGPITSSKLADYKLGQNASVRPGGEALLIYRLWRPKESKWYPTTEGLPLLPGISDENRAPNSPGTQASPQDSGSVAKPNNYWAWWVQKPKQPLPKYIPSRTDIQKPNDVPLSPGGQWLVFPPSATNSANAINSNGTSPQSNSGIPSGTWAWMVGENAPGTAGQKTPQTNKGEPSRRGRWLWIGSPEGAATTPLPDRPISFPAPPQSNQESGKPHLEWRGPLWLPYFRRTEQNDVVSTKPQEPEWVGPLWLPWQNATPTIPSSKQLQPGIGETPAIISPAPAPAPTIPRTPPVGQPGSTFDSASPITRAPTTNIPSARPELPIKTTCESLAARDAEIREIPMKSYRTSNIWRQTEATKWQATPGDVSIYPGAAVSIRLAGPSSIVEQNDPEISDQLARLIDNKSGSRTGSWVIIHPTDIQHSEEEMQLVKTCPTVVSGAPNFAEQPRGFWAYLNSPETFGKPASGSPSNGEWKWIGRLPPNSPVPKPLPNVPSDVQSGPIDKQAPDIPQAYEPLTSASPRQLDVDATGRIVDSPPPANPKEAGQRPWLGPLWLPFKHTQLDIQRQVESDSANEPAAPVSELSWIGPFWFPRSDTPANPLPKQPPTPGLSNGDKPSRGSTDQARSAVTSPGSNGDNTNNPPQVPTGDSAKPMRIQATTPSSRPNNGNHVEKPNDNTGESKRPGTTNQTQSPSVNENEPSTLPNAEIGNTTKLPGIPGNNPTPLKILILPQTLGTPGAINRPAQGIPDQTRPTITSPGTGVQTSSNPQQANGDSANPKKPSKTPTQRPGEGKTAQPGSEFPQTPGGLTPPATIPPVEQSREIIPGTVPQRPFPQQLGKGSVVPPRQSGRKPINKVPNGKLQELTNATSLPNKPVQKPGDTVIQKPDEIPKLKNGQNEPPSGQPNKSAEDSSPHKPATPVVSPQGTPGPGTKPPGATDTKPAGQVGNTVQPTIKQPPADAGTTTPNTSGSTPLFEAPFKVWRPSTGTWVDADQMTFELSANVGSNAPNNPNGTTPNGNRPGHWIFLINGPETQTPAIASNGTQSNSNGRWIFLELPSSQSLNNTGFQSLDRDTKNPQAEQAPSTSKGFWVWLGGDKNKQPEHAQQKPNSSPTSSQPNRWLWIGDSKDAGQRPNYSPQLDPSANRKGLASIPKPTPQTAMSSEEPRRTIHLVAAEVCSSGKRQKRSMQPADAPIINVNCYWFGPAYLAVGQEGRTDNPSDKAPALQASSSQSPNYVGPMWIPVPKEVTEGLPSGSGTFYPPGKYAANKPGQIYEIANPENGLPNVVYKVWNPTTDSWQTVNEGVPVSALQRWNPQRTFADGNINQPNDLRKENLPEHQWAWLAPKKQNPGQSPAAAPQSSGDKGTWVILNPWISNSTDHSPIKPESINNFRPMPFWTWLSNETTPELGPKGSGGKWVWIGPKDGAGKPPSQTPDTSKFTAPTELFRPDQSTESQQVPHPFKVVFTRPTREIDEALSAIPHERILPDANNPDWLGPIWIPKSADKAKPFEPGKEGQHPDWLGPLWLPQPKGHDVAHPDSQYGLNDPDLSKKPALPNNPTALPKYNIANPQPNAPVSPQVNLPNAPGQGQIAPIIPGLPKPGEVIGPSPSSNLANGAPTPLPSAALQSPHAVPRTTSTNGATPSNVAELPNGQQSPSAKPQRTIVLPVKTIQMVPSALTPSHPQLQKPNAQNPTQPDPSTNPANQGGAPGTPNPFQQAGPPASLQPPNMPRRENDRSNPMANSPIQTTSPSYPLPPNVGNPAMIPFPSSNPNQAQPTTAGASIVLPAGPSSPSPPGAFEPRNPIGMPFDNKPLLPSGSSTPGELKPVVQPLMGGNPFTGNPPVLPGSAPQSPIKPTTIYLKQPALPGGSDGIQTNLPPPSLPNSTSASITSPLPEIKPSPFSLLGPPNPAGPVLPASLSPPMGPSSLVPESKSLVGILPQTSHVNPQQGTILPSPGNQPGNSNSITDRLPLGTAMPLPPAFPGEAALVHTLGAQIPGSSTNTPIILPSGNQHLPAGQAGIPGMLHPSGLVPVVPPRLPDNHGSFKPGPMPEPVPYTPNHPNEPAQPNTVTPSPPFGQTTGNVLPEELKALHPSGVAPHGWLIPPKPHFPNSVPSSPELVPKPYGRSLPKPELQPVIQPQSMPHLRKPYQPRQPIPAMPAFPLKPIYPIVRQPPKPELRPLAPQVRYPSPVPPELKPVRPVVRPIPKGPGPGPSNPPLKPELKPFVRPPGPPIRPIVPNPAISPLNAMPVRKPPTFEQKPIIPAATPLRPNINRLQLLKPANNNSLPPRELQPLPAKPLPIAPHDALPTTPLKLQPSAVSKPIVILPQATLIQPKFNPPMKHREEEPINPAEFGLAPKGHPHLHPQIAVRPIIPSLTPNPMAIIEPHPQALPHGNPLAIPNPHDVPLLNQPVHHLQEPLMQPIAHQHQDPHVHENDPHLHPHLLLPSKNMPYHHDHGSMKPQTVPAPAAA